MTAALALDLARILEAARHIDPVFLDSPVLTDPALDAALGCSMFLKDETRNPIGSFKGRGAELLAATALRPGEALVAASAGNFGQGLAWAARRRGHACIIFAATTANPLKVDAMRRFGAELRLEGADFDAAKVLARIFAGEHGRRFVEDGAEPAIAEGAATLGLELAASVPGLDVLLVPLGNGALLAGVGAAMRHRAPRTQVIGVVAENAPSMLHSLSAGRVVEAATAATIADGIAVRVPVPEALAMLHGRYDAILAVSDDAIRAAICLVHAHPGLLAEPAGVAGLAAVLADPDRFCGKRVATILCGRNISAALRQELFAT